jgi:hypothetical protein
MEPKKPRKNANPINPVTGITDGKLRTLIKGNLRPIWRDTSRRVFIASIRRQERNPATGKMRFVIDCADCSRTMGISEKEFRTLKSGKKRAKASLVYEIDHVDGITPLAGIQATLGDYVESLLFGAQQAVCHACHAERTAAQLGARKNK